MIARAFSNSGSSSTNVAWKQHGVMLALLWTAIAAHADPTASFGVALVVPSPGFPRSVVALDLTGDGVADAALSVEDLGVVVYHNDGMGALNEVQRIPLAFTQLQGVRTIVGGDLDGDGMVDLVLARRDAGTSTFALFLLF